MQAVPAQPQAYGGGNRFTSPHPLPPRRLARWAPAADPDASAARRSDAPCVRATVNMTANHKIRLRMSAHEDIPPSEKRSETSVAVVTDSTPYLPQQLIERWQIHQVSLYVGWDGDLRPEREYEDLDAFYARLRDSPRLPTTSQPSVGDFLACYEPLLAAGHDV